MALVVPDQSGTNGDVFTGKLDSFDALHFPEVTPRIGDQYQVEIPSVLGNSDSELYRENHVSIENGGVFPFNYVMGLPIPVIWENLKFEPISHHTAEFPCESEISSPMNGNLGSWSSKGKCFCLDDDNTNIKLKSYAVSAKTGASFATLDTEEKQRQCMCPGYHLVPGSDFNCWIGDEKKRFLLGLYIFEKDFVRVTKFVETKTVGDILSFYYGEFYGSREYQRWSKRSKKKGRKVVVGENIFTGARQQEFLSRLLPSVSDECRNDLIKVAKTYEARKMSMEEFVFALKAMIGTNILVEAVAIGNKKKDLTSSTIDLSLSNRVLPKRSEIPTDKAFADLAPGEIIEFLSGDYRLRKARANDLFWEAVWPRLLARGWQSLQPKNESRDSLVFIVPGVKKFSRKKLTKGKQYYDSVPDILSRVKSEPELLELNGDVKDSIEIEQDTPERKEKKDKMPSRKCHLYLQPRTPSRKSCGMKFTIVDTSLAGDRPYKVKDLTDLSFDSSGKMTLWGDIECEDKSTSELSSDESGAVSAMFVDQANTDDAKTSFLDQKIPDLPHVKGLRGLSACTQPDICSPLQFCPSEPKMTHTCSGSGGIVNEDSSLSVSSQGKVSSTTTSPSFYNEWTEGALPNDGYVEEHLAENKQDMDIIDLNFPQVPPNFGSVDKEIDAAHHQEPNHKKEEIAFYVADVATSQQQHEEVERRQDKRNRPPTDAAHLQEPNHEKEEIASHVADVATSQQQEVERRQGKRNRPPTAKVLEALADGLLTTNTKKHRIKKKRMHEGQMP